MYVPHVWDQLRSYNIMHDDSLKVTPLRKQLEILMSWDDGTVILLLHAKKIPCSDLEIPVNTEKLRPRIEADLKLNKE